MTLIEVVAAISLATTAIVLILNSVSQHQRQIRRVAERKQAAELLDRQIAAWFASEAGIPQNANGVLPGGEFAWSCSVRPGRNQSSILDVETVVVSAFHRSRPEVRLIEIELVRSRQSRQSEGDSRGAPR